MDVNSYGPLKLTTSAAAVNSVSASASPGAGAIVIGGTLADSSEFEKSKSLGLQH